MPTNKQKRALRNRQKIANRQVSKTEQISRLVKDLDSRPVNPVTGQPYFGKGTNDEH